MPIVNQPSTQARVPESKDLLALIEANPMASLEAVLARVPTLATSGFDHGGRRRDTSDDAWAQYRAAMTSPDSVRMFVQAARWIAQAKHLPHMNRQLSSYHWKHVAESWGDNHYIMNGVFLAACYAMGVRVEPIPGSLNAAVNLT